MNWVEVTVLLGTITASGGAIAAWVKVPREKDALYITTTQGATRILHDLTDTLYQEIERTQKMLDEERDGNAQLQLRLKQLELENQGLREKYGTRFSDPAAPPSAPAP